MSATPMTPRQRLMFAENARREHDPEYQEGNGYDRCALCNYTRHPCDTFDLASYLIEALSGVRQGGDQ